MWDVLQYYSNCKPIFIKMQYIFFKILLKMYIHVLFLFW